MNYSILVAEDEPGIATSLQFLMQQFDSDVRVAYDGPTAIEMVSAKTPDLLLLDIMMPGFDGFEVLNRLRSNQDWCDIGVMVLSAKGHDVDREKALQLGVVDYITKPFATRELVQKVKDFLTGNRLASGAG